MKAWKGRQDPREIVIRWKSDSRGDARAEIQRAGRNLPEGYRLTMETIKRESSGRVVNTTIVVVHTDRREREFTAQEMADRIAKCIHYGETD